MTLKLPCFVDTRVCGSAKSCFRDPVDCSIGTCHHLLTWIYDDREQTVSFELEARVKSRNSYVAFGLSFDQKMVVTHWLPLSKDHGYRNGSAQKRKLLL